MRQVNVGEAKEKINRTLNRVSLLLLLLQFFALIFVSVLL